MPCAAGPKKHYPYTRDRRRKLHRRKGCSSVSSGCVSGVNVKLAKCGGIRRALELAHTARAHGMMVMLGCMVETSLGTAAAAHISGLVDFVDLDGPLLLADDPFGGLRFEKGRILLPDIPGSRGGAAMIREPTP